MATFEKIINFRQAGGTELRSKSGGIVKDGMLYRSARLDSATNGDKALLKELKIKSVIDLRGKAGYSKRSKGSIEDLYTPVVIENGLIREQAKPNQSSVGYVYIIDVLNKSRFGWHVLKQVNPFLWLLVLLLLPMDFLFGTRLVMQLCVKQVINKMEVWEHYIDVLEYCKPEVAEVLRLVSDPMNLPALIHCELGKDRTGYIVALILSCLEVEEETIIQDYAKTDVSVCCMSNGEHLLFFS